MSIPILVVSQTESFGELIRQTLDEMGKYRATLATSPEQALATAGKIPFALVILDLDPPEGARPGDWPVLMQAVRALSPSARSLLILPASEPDPLVEKLAGDACLNKPFYLPDLLERVGELVEKRGEVWEKAASPAWPNRKTGSPRSPGRASPAGTPLQARPAALDWLQDVSRAARHLMRLSLEADAQAALITRNNALWAYAGQLPQTAAQELAQVVIQSGMHGDLQRGDLARFVRLASNGGEYMLYATSLGSEMVLALAFDAATPFSKIRAQASSLARALAEPPDLEEPAATEPLRSLSSVSAPEEISAGKARLSTGGQWSDLAPEESVPEEDLPLAPLFSLEDVPPPDPTHLPVPILEGRHPDRIPEYLPDRGQERTSDSSPEWEPAPSSDWQPENPPNLQSGLKTRLEADSESPAGQKIGPHPVAPPDEGLPLVVWPHVQADPSAAEGEDPSFEFPAWIEASPSESEPLSVGARLPLPFEETLEVEPVAFPLQVPVETPAPGPLGPASPAYYSLNYACVLIPRLPRHHLAGPLSGFLSDWVRQLCQAFGWRLEHLSIRPDYLLWISSVPPHTSPGYMVKMMRRHTSQRIFYEFPLLAHENPSGDFWSPGYLVIATSQPPPPQVLVDFVSGTRRQQGEAGSRR